MPGFGNWTPTAGGPDPRPAALSCSPPAHLPPITHERPRTGQSWSRRHGLRAPSGPAEVALTRARPAYGECRPLPQHPSVSAIAPSPHGPPNASRSCPRATRPPRSRPSSRASAARSAAPCSSSTTPAPTRPPPVAKAAGATVLRLPLGLGAWGATQAGIRYARRNGFTNVITLDADGQHVPDSLPMLLERPRTQRRQRRHRHLRRTAEPRQAHRMALPALSDGPQADRFHLRPAPVR